MSHCSCRNLHCRAMRVLKLRKLVSSPYSLIQSSADSTPMPELSHQYGAPRWPSLHWSHLPPWISLAVPAALLAPRHQIPDIGGASCAEGLAVTVALRAGPRAIMGIRLAMRIPEASRTAPEIARRAALTIDAIGIDRRHRNYLWGELDDVGYVSNALVPPPFGLVEVKFEEDDKGQILSLQAPRRAAIPAVAIDREPRLLALLPALDVARPDDVE